MDGLLAEGLHASRDHSQLLRFERALHDALEDAGSAKRHDHSGQAQEADKEAVEHAENRADDDGHQHGEQNASLIIQIKEQLCGRIRRQRRERREGDVDAAGENDEELAHGEQARHDHSLGDIDDVIRRIELA